MGLINREILILQFCLSRLVCYTKYCFLLLLSLQATFSSNAQGNAALQSSDKSNLGGLKPLKIGEKVPNLLLGGVINSAGKSIRISDYHGKLLLIDFWATWCAPCVEGIYKSENLKKELGDEGKLVEFLLVNEKNTNDDENVVRDFFNRRNRRTGLGFPSSPMILKDTVLTQLFPHVGIPHYVWVNKEGKVMAITSALEITSKNIKSALSGNFESIRIKGMDKGWLTLQDIKTLFDDKNSENDEDIFRDGGEVKSFITGYKDGYSGEVATDIVNNEAIGLAVFNYTLMHLIARAYSEEIQGIPRNRWILDVKNPLQYQPYYEDSLMYKYTYCYGIKVPASLDKYKLKFMQDDLKKGFNISLKKIKKKIKCIKLMETQKIINNSSDGIVKSEMDIDSESLNKYLRATSMQDAIHVLNSISKIPLINGVISENIRIDIKLPFNLKDQKELLESLKKAGFLLLEEEREIDVVVITDF